MSESQIYLCSIAAFLLVRVFFDKAYFAYIYIYSIICLSIKCKLFAFIAISYSVLYLFNMKIF
uniref:Uncharacterized protein n=1 Tax=Leptosiphonia brodiei TaxID=2608611 RepID=A0A1Z1MAT1_9FLOR|nr:hypothetical protein [Leptosiphonia brodiei]ARW62982.1 hypothetical protein [Leptosiphonia brodiei]